MKNLATCSVEEMDNEELLEYADYIVNSGYGMPRSWEELEDDGLAEDEKQAKRLYKACKKIH